MTEEEARKIFEVLASVESSLTALDLCRNMTLLFPDFPWVEWCEGSFYDGTTCPHCDGTGSTNALFSKKCPYCAGSGWVV